MSFLKKLAGVKTLDEAVQLSFKNYKEFKLADFTREIPFFDECTEEEKIRLFIVFVAVHIDRKVRSNERKV